MHLFCLKFHTCVKSTKKVHWLAHLSQCVNPVNALFILHYNNFCSIICKWLFAKIHMEE